MSESMKDIFNADMMEYFNGDFALSRTVANSKTGEYLNIPMIGDSVLAYRKRLLQYEHDCLSGVIKSADQFRTPPPSLELKAIADSRTKKGQISRLDFLLSLRGKGVIASVEDSTGIIYLMIENFMQNHTNGIDIITCVFREFIKSYQEADK